MAYIPEFILQTTIVRGIKALRKDTTLLDQLFKNLSQAHLQQMRNFVVNDVIDLCINYPRKTLTLPAIVILLRAENEEQAFLGDSMGFDCGPDSDLSYEGADEALVLGGVSPLAASLEEVNRRRLTVDGPRRVTSSTNNTLKVSAKNTWVGDQFGDGNYSVHIVGGTGLGQVRDITANSGDTLMVTPNWEANPDATSIFEIRERQEEVIGQPSSLYNRKDVITRTHTERRGSYYRLQYQIQVIGDNPEKAIYLYMILKALFTLQRQFLEKQKIINLQMGGTDFVNRAEYLPDHSYMRAMNLSFITPFNVFETVEALTRFNLVVESCDYDPPRKDVVYETEIDLSPPDAEILE